MVGKKIVLFTGGVHRSVSESRILSKHACILNLCIVCLHREATDQILVVVDPRRACGYPLY